MIRTHEAGGLRASDADQQVTLAGWVARRRDHGGVVFIDLRDASGVVQVVLRVQDVAHELRAEFCVLVTGQVRRRPEGNENPELPTGDIEIAADAVEVLSECDPLPFPVDGQRGPQRGGPAAVPVPGHPPGRDGGGAAGQVQGGLPGGRHDAPARLRERGDPVPDQVHAGGGAGLPGARAAAARQLVRAAAVAAAVQAAADGLRARTLLPARAVLPRRGLQGPTGSRNSLRSTSRCRS